MERVVSTWLTKMDNDPDGRPPILDQISPEPQRPLPYGRWSHHGQLF